MSSTRLTLGVPDSVLIALAVLVVSALAMRLLIAGQWVRASGTAERVAALAGVPTRRVVTGIFAYSGAALLRVGVSVVGAPPQYRQILYGVIILVAVALSIDRSKLPTIK
jgi:ribose/xylose/arabinose/galactoside ABC-type transport system permease subunit